MFDRSAGGALYQQRDYNDDFIVCGGRTVLSGCPGADYGVRVGNQCGMDTVYVLLPVRGGVGRRIVSVED